MIHRALSCTILVRVGHLARCNSPGTVDVPGCSIRYVFTLKEMQMRCIWKHLPHAACGRMCCVLELQSSTAWCDCVDLHRKYAHNWKTEMQLSFALNN